MYGWALLLVIETGAIAASKPIAPGQVQPASLDLRLGQEAFRLPKLLASEWLGLASLLPLAFRLRSVDRVSFRDLGRLPALLAVAPLVAVATFGLAVSRHPFHLHEALVDLAPVVNVVLLLICFFLLSSSFVLQPGIKVDPPRSVIAVGTPASNLICAVALAPRAATASLASACLRITRW